MEKYIFLCPLEVTSLRSDFLSSQSLSTSSSALPSLLFMWASPGRNHNNRSSIYLNSLSKSSSPAPTDCSSPSQVVISEQSAENPMEEVWKDISLTSLNDHPAISARATNRSLPSMILQDFLATSKEQSRRGNVSMAEETNLFGYLAHTPGTLLSLNSGSDFHYIETATGDHLPPSSAVNDRATVGSTHHNSAFHVFGTAANFPPLCQKRGLENRENSDDRQNKRMMKNRESAARSRARKQAYTDKLELEVAHLQKENAKLKRQQEKLLAEVPSRLPRKNTLTRTLTAPF